MTRTSAMCAAWMAIIVVAALVACTGERGLGTDLPPEPTPSSLSTSAPDGDDGLPSPPLDPSAVGVPVDRDCNQILSPDALYMFNPNVGTDPDYVPTGLARQAVANGGVACGWLNQTSGEKLSVSVGRFNAEGIEVVRGAAAARTGATDLDTIDGYFTETANGGAIEFFVDQYWVVLESPSITGPDDVLEVIQSITESLG